MIAIVMALENTHHHFKSNCTIYPVKHILLFSLFCFDYTAAIEQIHVLIPINSLKPRDAEMHQ